VPVNTCREDLSPRSRPGYPAGLPKAVNAGRVKLSDWLVDLLSDVLAGGRRWQRLAVALHGVDPFIHDLAELSVDLALVAAVATRPDDAGTLADEALVLVGPFYQLDVACAFFHCREPSLYPRWCCSPRLSTFVHSVLASLLDPYSKEQS
jgi:hypothetical protein